MTGIVLAYLALSLWLYQDADARQLRRPLAWVGLLWLLGPLAMALYVSRRPLFAVEQRVGGRAWILLRAFVVAATAWMVVLSTVVLIWLSVMMPLAALVALMFTVGLALAGLWSLLAFFLLSVGWLLRDGRRIERGPSHPNLVGQPLPHWGDRLLKVIFLGALLLVFIFTDPDTPEWMQEVEWNQWSERVVI